MARLEPECESALNLAMVPEFSFWTLEFDEFEERKGLVRHTSQP
jgi:hypothetical protein